MEASWQEVVLSYSESPVLKNRILLKSFSIILFSALVYKWPFLYA